MKNILFFFVLSALLFSCGHSGYVSEDGLIWNTSFHIVYNGPESLRDSVMQVLDEVGRSLSVFDKSSLVSRVNVSDSVEVDRHFASVFAVSTKVSEESDGAFDPSLSPLITAWGFGPGHKATPDTARVDSILRFVGISRSLISDDGRIIKGDRRMQFNFSAVAKGYACDEVGRMLARNGVSDWLVEIGGEVATSGNGPSGAWSVAVDRPVFSPGEAIHETQAILRLSGDAVATSGNYRNLLMSGERYYAHTISPRTGRPIQTDVISATIVAPTCAEADAYATACMAMGGDAARKMIAERHLKAMLVMNDSSVFVSPWLDKYIELSE